MSNPKILFLEVSAGGGHKSITTAIIQALNLLNPNIDCIRFDPSNSYIHKSYQIISKQLQFLYSRYYKFSNSYSTRKFLTPLIYQSRISEIQKLILYEKPNAIITNTLFAIDILPQLIKQLNQNIPFFVFVPDPITPHAVYYSSKATHTFVPTISAFQFGLQIGLKFDQMTITGHPVKQEFFNTPENLIKHKKSLNLDPYLFTITIGGSGDGIEKSIHITQELNKLLTNQIQIIYLTGNNKQLANNLNKLKLSKIKSIILPSINNVHDYIHASDLVASKAGPNILFETIASGKPFIATNHIEGQENGNLEFIKSTQSGFIEENPTKAAQLIIEITKNPSLLNHAHLGIQNIQSQLKNSANTLAQELLNRSIS